MDVDGYCEVCQDAHKMIDSCLQNVQCKHCFKKGHLRIDCLQDSSTNEVVEKKTGCGIKRKAKVVIDEGNIGSKVCREVLPKMESNYARIIDSDSIKVEHLESDSMKQEYYEDQISKKETVDENIPKVEYFEEFTPDSVKSENIGGHTKPSASDTKPVDDPDNPALEESVPPVPPVKWIPTNAKFWQLKNLKKMAVFCPGDNCYSFVKISNIALHIRRQHPNLIEGEIFCQFCQGIVFPKDVSKHMPKCSSTTPLGKSWLAAQKSSIIPRTSPDFNSQFWKTGPKNTVVCPNETCDYTANYHQVSKHIDRHHTGMMKDNIFCQFCKGIVFPAQVSNHMQFCSSSRPLLSILHRTSSGLRENFPEVPLLPGLTAVPIDSDGLSYFSAKIFLDFFLVKNYMESDADTIKCSWMFMNYMETNKIERREEVLSPSRFLLVVKELSSDRWSKDVGPFREKESDAFESLYFLGLKLKDQVM